jgi:hypothetical protein
MNRDTGILRLDTVRIQTVPGHIPVHLAQSSFAAQDVVPGVAAIVAERCGCRVAPGGPELVAAVAGEGCSAFDGHGGEQPDRAGLGVLSSVGRSGADPRLGRVSGCERSRRRWRWRRRCGCRGRRRGMGRVEAGGVFRCRQVAGGGAGDHQQGHDPGGDACLRVAATPLPHSGRRCGVRREPALAVPRPDVAGPLVSRPVPLLSAVGILIPTRRSIQLCAPLPRATVCPRRRGCHAERRPTPPARRRREVMVRSRRPGTVAVL